MSDDLTVTNNFTIYSPDGTQGVTVTTVDGKERLDVDTNLIARVEQPVHEFDNGGSGATKISYTVPVGKILYIQTLTSAYASTAGGENAIEWREDATPFHPQYIADASGFAHSLFTDGNPIGPFAAGVVISAERTAGPSRAWSAAFTGYLIDA